MRIISACALLVIAMSAAAAQPAAPVENVTVTGTRTREVIDSFVQSLAVPTRMTGKLARWEDPICPISVGLQYTFLRFIDQRVRDVAQKSGAPVATDKSCKPNIEIIFTTTPQDLMDNVRREDEAFLGYADSRSKRTALATVNLPAQAWYTTATRDLRGKWDVDSAKGGGMTVDMAVPAFGGGAGSMPSGTSSFTMTLPGAHGREVSGSRVGDGLRSGLYHVIIVAEPAKLLDHEIGTLADYIAMLSLAQFSGPDKCQPLPSILNLLVENCGQKTDRLTDNDLAYLRGLYAMSPDHSAGTQESEISYQMEQALNGKAK
jgi:hypothetical protein